MKHSAAFSVFGSITTTTMTTIHQKFQILESLDSMDKAQMEKVMKYIQGLLDHPKQENSYSRFKNQALREIQKALRENKAA